VEQFYPDLIPNLSSCKSPQQMMGAIIKSYFAEKEKIDTKKIVSVSIMPCTAKKFESGRPEMGRDHTPDVDYVLTTRELGRLLRLFGINLMDIEPQTADNPFGERSTAGKIFGASGGVMEAAIRTAHFLLTGEELAKLDVLPVRGMKGVKELRTKIGDLEVGAAVVNSLLNARKILDEIRAGRKDLHFIEFMTCPGGCINGGGQPIGIDPNAAKARMAALYTIDETAQLRVSHKNQHVKRLYDEFLGKPLGEKSHHLLHTHYATREVL
jgi:NADH-quinone oxidoreductase subunit G/NADP-reducing hydrogenase subunit HndD